MKLTIQEAVKELFYWRLHGGRATNFTALLYDLISKADPQNREALRAGFPYEVNAWERWQDSEDEQEFFARHGMPVRKTTIE